MRQKPLRTFSGKIADIGKAQVPALMQLRLLGPLPKFVHVAANEDFDVDAHDWCPASDCSAHHKLRLVLTGSQRDQQERCIHELHNSCKREDFSDPSKSPVFDLGFYGPRAEDRKLTSKLLPSTEELKQYDIATAAVVPSLLPMFDESPQRQTPDALMLRGFWYRALPGRQVRRAKLEKAMLLETPLVLGRDAQGRPFALQDACPHRGMPLSCGRFDGAQVECSYHGWRFDAHSGQCQLIPSLTADQKLKVDRIYAGSYACAEHDDFIWVFIPEPVAASAGFTRRPEPPLAAPRVPTFSENYKLAYLTSDLPCSVDHGIIGLMDPAHGPFVHQAWWWRSRDSIHEKRKSFEPIPQGFRMSAHTPSSNSAPYKLLKLYANADSITTTIDFTLPNMRWETIRAGKYWFSSLTTVTPITRSHCRIDVVAAWNIFRWVPFGAELLKFVFAKFVEQDRKTMEEQSEGLKNNPHLMLIDDADRPAKWYFQLKQAYLESCLTGAAFQHPIPGPVTLRWRS